MESTQIYCSELHPSLKSYIPTTTGDVCPSCNSESLCSGTVGLTYCSLKSTERQPLTPPGSHADLMQSTHQHIQTTHHCTSFRKRSHKILRLAQNKTPNQQPSRQLCSSYLSFPKLATEDHHVWCGKGRRKAKRKRSAGMVHMSASAIRARTLLNVRLTDPAPCNNQGERGRQQCLGSTVRMVVVNIQYVWQIQRWICPT